MSLRDKEIGYKTYSEVQELQIQEQERLSQARKEKDVESIYDSKNRISALIDVKEILVKNFGLEFNQ